MDLAAQGRLRRVRPAGLHRSWGSDVLCGGSTVFRRAAVYVDKILKGGNRRDAVGGQPLWVRVNTKTAQTLGLTIPPDVAAQVTQWVSNRAAP